MSAECVAEHAIYGAARGRLTTDLAAESIQSIDLSDERTLADATERRVAAHLACSVSVLLVSFQREAELTDGVEPLREQDRSRSTSSRRSLSSIARLVSKRLVQLFDEL